MDDTLVGLPGNLLHRKSSALVRGIEPDDVDGGMLPVFLWMSQWMASKTFVLRTLYSSASTVELLFLQSKDGLKNPGRWPAASNYELTAQALGS